VPRQKRKSRATPDLRISTDLGAIPGVFRPPGAGVWRSATLEFPIPGRPPAPLHRRLNRKFKRQGIYFLMYSAQSALICALFPSLTRNVASVRPVSSISISTAVLPIVASSLSMNSTSFG